MGRRVERLPWSQPTTGGLMDEDSNDDNTGGGEGGRTFTQDDVNRINAKANKRIGELQTQLDGSPRQSAVDDLQAQLDAMASEKELAGKSEVERLQHEHSRALEKMANKYGTIETELKARDEAMLLAQTTLRNERLARSFGAALTKAKVYPAGAADALAVLMNELKDSEVDASGSITASYGSDMIDEGPEAIAAKFLADRPYFATAGDGGAGTPKPNSAAAGRPGTLDEMTSDELFADAGPDPSARH